MIGRTLSHYRITGQLGAGGMGIVYSGEDERLGRQVALKFISDEFAGDEQAIMRLRSEAKAASALNHPNICTIYDIGEQDGHHFIVMELMTGQSLRHRLNQGSMKVLQLVDIGIEMADALHAAHASGIIHRDIKPANVFLNDRAHIKILDFGLAKSTSKPTQKTAPEPLLRTSASGVIHGTLAYMSPEQAAGEPLDARTDLFSVGVVLYECATGQHPFPGDTAVVVLTGILDRAPTSPLFYNPDLPQRLVEIIGNCLEKDRELRYQSAADLRADLKRLRRDLESGTSRPDPTAFGATQRGPLTVYPDVTPSRQYEPIPPPSTPIPAPAQSGRGLWLAAGLVVTALVASTALVIWTRPGDSTVTPLTSEPLPPTPGPAPTEAQATVSVERQMTLATASMNAGNYRAALTTAREVLALDPNHEAALLIRDQATTMLSRFDNEVADARRRLTNGDLEGAARAIDRARAIDPSSPSIPELSGRLSEAFRTRSSVSASRTLPDNQVAERSQPAAPAPPAAAAAPAPSNTPPVTVPVAMTPTPLPEPPAARPAEVAKPDPPPPVIKETPPAPVADRPSPPPPNGEADNAAIRQVIGNYGRAIENKDLRLFRSIKPNLTDEEQRRLQDGFRAVTSQRVSLTILSIDRKGDQASALIRRQDQIVAGGRSQKTDAQQAVTLQRTASGWVITDIR